MKAVILEGSLDHDPLVDQACEAIFDELGCLAWQVEALTLREMEIRPCAGCFGCWIKRPGECLVDDAGRDVARAVIQSDLVIYLTPVTFGGYSSELKKALDRSICLVSPFFAKIDGEVHHRSRYEHYPRLVGVGVLAQPDAASEQVFVNLVARNAINMHAPAHAGGVVHGEGAPEGIRAGIRALLQAVEVVP